MPSKSPQIAGEPFADAAALEAWLAEHHASETELWVRLYKKDSGVPSVAWGDCVIAGLIWGWIDGQKKPLDEASWLQRMTPRRPRSPWSARNVAHAERLIAEGRMQPPGLAQVEAARADGRWDAAYAAGAEMEVPADFLAALEERPEAKARYASLKRAELFLIYYRLHSAKRPETRAKRMETFLAQLARGEAPH
ncbi:YdeI/OmpD-associated family protein [Pseudoroseicyclus tamaricis]|uniref:Bacteriocin resistance YdeI/OmpD-like protein n=1 Tax=Pseudoroseicyclus tamaricis TaxID=2705421 RepID=A0A6B2JNA8_9RHOB|nr:YdeI/OmpD-associated family protein [Pseudoroseicyclus tamaricis]NDV00157.1 hypothetical protein [Pseudoroseicyclus tamaricis]